MTSKGGSFISKKRRENGHKFKEGEMGRGLETEQ